LFSEKVETKQKSLRYVLDLNELQTTYQKKTADKKDGISPSNAGVQTSGSIEGICESVPGLSL
jgi:hypothetical protein